MCKGLTAQKSTEVIRKICSKSPVIPVLTVDEIQDAIPLATALIDGGLTILEVTLRTPNALRIVEEISQMDQAIVGVGTLIDQKDVENAVKVGAKFGVSPGVTDHLVDACQDNGIPLLGGVSTACEVMRMLDRGYEIMKFFPADVAGGMLALKALQGPFPQVSFCPTGGISGNNAEEYLALKNVLCVGGSWVATPGMISNKNWYEITKRAKHAAMLGS